MCRLWAIDLSNTSSAYWIAVGKDANMTTAPNKTAHVRDIFFAREVPYGLALVRIFMPWVLMCVVAPRWIHSRELFSSDGAATPLHANFGMPDLLPELPGTVVVGLMTILVFSLITSSIGWCTRFSLSLIHI